MSVRALKFTTDAMKFIENLQSKFYKQIVMKILGLLNLPLPHDSNQLHGTKTPRFRVDSGEYRIIYSYDSHFVYIETIGKRNDGEVYKKDKRKK